MNIKNDLKNRKIAQQAEILAISGPTAPVFMKAMAEEKWEYIQNRWGLTLNREIAEPIINKYYTMIIY